MGDRDHDLTMVARLVGVWSKMSKEPDFPMTPDHCVNGTRVAKEVLSHFGVKSWPMSVGVVLFNRFAYELHINGVFAPEWPEHAWSVGVAPGHPSAKGGWNGHLLLEGDAWTLDISAQQFDRPGLISVPNALWFNQSVKPEGEQSIFIDSRLQVMVVWRVPENRAWRQAAGWRVTRTNQRLIDQCITRMYDEEERNQHDGGAEGSSPRDGGGPADGG